MPLLARRGERYVSAVRCGAGLDAFIEIEFSETPVAHPELIALPPIRHGLSDGVDPAKILDAALEAAEAASTEFGVRYYLKKIGYVPNDSRHYRLHGRCVWEIIRHLARGGEFRELDETR